MCTQVLGSRRRRGSEFSQVMEVCRPHLFLFFVLIRFSPIHNVITRLRDSFSLNYMSNYTKEYKEYKGYAKYEYK